MSRIGKQSITIPTGVNVDIKKGLVTVSGPRASISVNIPLKIEVEIKENQLIVRRLTDDRQTKANHGTTRALLNNTVAGVVNPWKKELEIRGTGYKFVLNNDKLIVSAGYIHTVEVPIPVGLEFSVAEDTKLTITGSDKELVGQTASKIRKIRKPEPYKGKGIRYVDEFIKLKAGKTAKA